MEVDHEVVGRAAQARSGVLSRAELTALGVTRWNIRIQLRARRWRLVGQRAVVVDRGPVVGRRREWVALLELDQGATLCGLTAAAAWGLTGFETDRVHVLVPKGSHVRAFDWLVVHESRRFEPVRDRHPFRQPAMVRAERAVIDAAVWSTRPQLACAIVAAAVRQRITTALRLDVELRAAGQVRHRKLLLAVLADIAGGAEALSEVDFVRLCRRHGLPAPLQQQVRTDPNGRRRYLDAAFACPNGMSLVVEVDGGIHLEPEVARDDAHRQNELVIGGELVLRFSSVTIRTQPEVVVDQLSRMFASHALREAAA